MKRLLTIALVLICSTAIGSDIVIQGVSPGTYVLRVSADGSATLRPATVVSPDGTTPPPPPVGGVLEVSTAEYSKITEAVREAHRLPLAEKFQGLAFGLTTKRLLTGKPFIALADAADAEMAILKDETGDDYDKFKAWQSAYRLAINATRPTNAEELAKQYDIVSESLAPAALDWARIIQIIMFILNLLKQFQATGGGT